VKYAATEMNTTTNNNKQEKTMSKRYYKEFSEYTFEYPLEVRVRDIKRNEQFCIYCEDESHADALVKELNRRGYDIAEFHACT
jgi:1,2-phenylacetyl-CoA epoxidase catalytic subunit